MSPDLSALIQTFAANNIQAEMVCDGPAALKRIAGLVLPGSSVAFAGSQTIREIGARDYFLERRDRFTIIDPYEPGIGPAEGSERRRRSLLADWLLTGSNAITLKGQIVNRDNQGNRVAGIAFGPKKVIIAVGINKIVKTLAEARHRIDTIAAPKNSARLARGNPCEADGVCHRCGLPTRICRMESVIDGMPEPGRLTVIIIDRELGF